MSVFSVNFGKKASYTLDPSVIKLPNHDLQGRFAATPKGVVEMADSLLTSGQKQNILVRKDNDNVPILVAGYRRRAAALMINENRHDKDFRASLSAEANAKLDAMGDAPFLLDVKLESINEKDAFLSNVTENMGRVELSPMDRLKIILVLRNTYKMPDADIAAVFGKKPWYVFHHLKLAELSPSIQQLVDTGVISLEVAAKVLVKVPEAQREMMVNTIIEERQANAAEDEATTADDLVADPSTVKKITGSVVAKHERERRAKTGEDGSKIKRTLADLKKFSRNFIEQHDNDPVANLFVDILAFVEGGITEATLVRRVKKHLGVETTTAAAPKKAAAAGK